MTAVLPVSAQWLALREPVDARSRSRRLATAALRITRSPVVVHDLGSGTGSMMRWLAPLAPRPHTWVLHDWNPSLLAHATAGVPASGLVVRTSVRDLARLRPVDVAGASLVTVSALLDVLTRGEIEAIVGACATARAPALFTLSVTGRVTFDPPDPDDRAFGSAFNDHQRRAVDGRRLMGPDAVGTAIDLFADRGWSVRTARSPWRLESSDGELMSQWLEGWLAAAVEQRPDLRARAEEYAVRRAAQLASGALRAVVHHRDFLAWPS